MLKKYKQFIIGFVLCAILLGAVPVGAAVKEYILKVSSTQIVVDGKPSNNSYLPILNYNGYNYIPAAVFRDICSNIGIDFQWVGDLNQIQISTEKLKAKEDDKLTQETAFTQDGLPVINIAGIKYISAKDFVKKYASGNVADTHLYSVKEEDDESLSIVKYFTVEKINPFGKKYNEVESLVMVKNIPSIRIVNGSPIGTYIELDYYVNTILPLIQ